MKIKIVFQISLLFLLSFKSKSQNLNCGLTFLTKIENFNVFKNDSSGAILFKAKLAIDADGSPRAYGPNNSGLDWTANAGGPGNWWGVVTDVNGNPILQGAGDPYPGMYVSTTSLVNAAYSNTNPLRYVDSENFPFIALPSALQSLANISMGDIVYAKNISNGNTSFAYLADTGPGGKLGEGSMFFAARLGVNNNPRTGGTSAPIIEYVVFPQSGYGQGTHLTVAQIDSIGQLKLTAAGGIGLPDCLNTTLNCNNAITLTCGVSYHGLSSTAQSLVEFYGCNNWTESGPERVHSITPTSTNGTITATITNFTGDLDVYILGSCNPSDCLGTVSSSSATYNNAIAGQTYYIVVDADDGSGSAYDLMVTCPVVTNVSNFTAANKLLIYPNPTNGVINILANNYTIKQIELLNTLGNKIAIFLPKNSINIKNYPKGLYFLKIITNDNKRSTFKIIKE